MMTKRDEIAMMSFAGQLTQTWVETLACFIGTDAEQQMARDEMLRQVRNAELAKVDAIERMLGITPTTADIRRWYKEQTKKHV